MYKAKQLLEKDRVGVRLEGQSVGFLEKKTCWKTE